MTANIGARSSEAAPQGTRFTVFFVFRVSVSGARFDGFVEMTGK